MSGSSNFDPVQLVELFRAGDENAATRLYDHYVDRMVRLAQSRMAPPLERRFDAEDVALSACMSFFVGLRDGRYDFGESRDVWRLLAAITINKLRHNIRHVSAAKRDIAKEENPSTGGSTLGLPIEAICREPTPEDIAICSETLTAELTPFSGLKRQIISQYLKGNSSEENAKAADCTTVMIQRTLRKFRLGLEQQLMDSSMG